MIANVATSSKIVVEKSTVPVKAAESIIQILSVNHKEGVQFQVGYEFELDSPDSVWKDILTWLGCRPRHMHYLALQSLLYCK